MSPFSHCPLAQRSRRDTPTGVAGFFSFFFFWPGPPFDPYPQLSEVTPPLTLPRLFPVALSALIVADWLNVEKPKREGPGVEKKEKEGEDLGKGGEKGRQGWRTPLLLFFH